MPFRRAPFLFRTSAPPVRPFQPVNVRAKCAAFCDTICRTDLLFIGMLVLFESERAQSF